MIEEATWELPEGHERLSAFASLEEAQNDARQRIRADSSFFYYLSDKRGAFEVIRYRRG